MDERALGELIGSGRATDVYACGDGRVLRRYRRGRSESADVAREALLMRHLHAHGYPVPTVFDADGADLVMERVSGRTMLATLAAQPWRFASLAGVLADLHRRLGRVPIEPLVAAGFRERFVGAHQPVDSIIHLDLHPDNVMLTSRGPVVFDWTNAALGPRAADVASTWLLLETGDVDDLPSIVRIVASHLRRR